MRCAPRAVPERAGRGYQRARPPRCPQAAGVAPGLAPTAAPRRQRPPSRRGTTAAERSRLSAGARRLVGADQRGGRPRPGPRPRPAPRPAASAAARATAAAACARRSPRPGRRRPARPAGRTPAPRRRRSCRRPPPDRPPAAGRGRRRRGSRPARRSGTGRTPRPRRRPPGDMLRGAGAGVVRVLRARGALDRRAARRRRPPGCAGTVPVGTGPAPGAAGRPPGQRRQRHVDRAAAAAGSTPGRFGSRAAMRLDDVRRGHRQRRQRRRRRR